MAAKICLLLGGITLPVGMMAARYRRRNRAILMLLTAPRRLQHQAQG